MGQNLQAIRNLIDTLPNGIGIYSRSCDQRIQLEYFNKKFYSMIGETKVADYTKNCKELFGPIHMEDLSDYIKYLCNYEKEDTPAAEVRLKQADGSYHWYRIQISLAEKQTDKEYLYVSFFDIHKLMKEAEEHRILAKQMEARIKLEEERTRNEESKMTAYVVSDLTTGCIVEHSDYSPNAPIIERTDSFEENSTAALQTVVYEDDKQAFDRMHSRAYLLSEFASGHTSTVVEFRREQPDGMITWTKNVMHLVENPNTLHVMLYEYCYDINATKSVEVVTNAAILLTFDCLASIDLVHGQTTYLRQDNVRTGKNVVIDDYNKAIHAYIKTAVAEGDQKRCEEAFRVDYIKEQLSKQEVFEDTFHIVAPDGSVHLMRNKYSYYDRKKSRCLMMRQDVTEIVKEEEQKRIQLEDALRHAESASKAKGEFLSAMSHEIRTPLNAIIGYLNMTKGADKSKEKISYYTQQSISAANHLLAIVNDILDMSTMENGSLKLERKNFYLDEVLKPLADMFTVQAKEKKIKFETKLSEIITEQLVGDSMRLNQILLNLLSNAMKFTPESGKVQLCVEALEKRSGKIHLMFKVTDTGIGMNKEFRNRIFKPFEQEDGSTARKYGGTGLGLSISNNLAHMMGGSINVESELNVGSIFTVTLPFDLAKKKENVAEQELFSDIRVVSLNADEGQNLNIKKMVENLGAKCDVFENAKKAIRRIKNRTVSEYPYDLCLIDWDMEEICGAEVVEQLKALCGDKKPLLVANVSDPLRIEVEAKSIGLCNTIGKPIFPITILDLLTELFGNRIDKKVEKQKIDFSGLKVLLAEDNHMNQEIAIDILSKAGMDIVAVENGEEAVNCFLQSEVDEFDLILMDIQMPVLDGLDAARVIRSGSHKRSKTIPIIAMSANAFETDVTAALAAGMNDHVAKPISFERLFQVIEQYGRR